MDGFSNGLTISVWLKTNNKNSQSIVSKLVSSGRTDDDAYWLTLFRNREYQWSNNLIEGSVQGMFTETHQNENDLKYNRFISSSEIIDDGFWHHIIYVWDGKNFKFYAPIGSMLLISFIITLLINLYQKFFK